MKKSLSIGLLLLLAIGLQACTKTDVENDLEKTRNSEELMTDEEAKILEGEDADFQQDYLQALADATEEQRLDESIALIDDIEGSKANKRLGTGSKGSCDAITSSSTCLEYYGSFWTEESAKFNCSDQGTFSTKPCPRDFSGGCNTGIGTAADMVAWMYLRGGGEMTNESMGYAKMACDSTLASNWIE